MEFKQLQHFTKIADAGSLTRAATTLGVTQAALSRQMSLLEAELEIELFRRNGRGVVLTDAGVRLQEHAHLILRQVAQARRAVQGGQGPILGTLALGLPPSLARAMSVPLIEAFQASLPEASMRSVDGLSVNLLQLVASGRLDCAVVYDPAPRAELAYVPLASEALYLVTATGASSAASLRAAVSIEEIAEIPLVIAGAHNAIHAVLESALATLGRTARIAHEIANLNAILDLVRRGHGASVIPLSGLHSCIGDPGLTLHRIHKPSMQCTLCVALPAENQADPLIDATMALLRKVIPEQLKVFHADVEDAIGRRHGRAS
ncbi:LysR family nitrogen assimilation transcriptional regulator [Variovorax boronicumulans]|uniref:LysR substrate-binding domain-containing protein n=1 Tax=Variovorax boronicumulans TaxID=436515 RepID=UPI002787D4D4|nr:LysR substrate-binding domain-containing protein [Variovorax boronicumulans]MDQ0073412.1 LysR family nitrogen assimilation transcriptional regulator [Variovorax boronicumulans]